MTDLDTDLLEARAILEGRTRLLPEVRHLKALQMHHEDTLVTLALKAERLHLEIMNTP